MANEIFSLSLSTELLVSTPVENVKPFSPKQNLQAPVVKKRKPRKPRVYEKFAGLCNF